MTDFPSSISGDTEPQTADSPPALCLSFSHVLLSEVAMNKQARMCASNVPSNAWDLGMSLIDVLTPFPATSCNGV